MKRTLPALAIVILLVTILIYKQDSDPPKRDVPTASSISPAGEPLPPPPVEAGVEDQRITRAEELAEALRVKEQEPGEFNIDMDRLFDKSYENDPELIALADLVGRTPTCLIESYKDALARIGLPGYEEVPPERLASICVRTREEEGDDISPLIARAEDPSYKQYSDAELESLATSDPAAALVLGRRTEANEAALHYYERAVALAWDSYPLSEFMYHRNIGGLEHSNDVLNVELAMKGYEIEVVSFLIDGKASTLVPQYQEELEKSGIDTREIEQSALDWFTRLEQQRRELTGGERP